MSERTLKIGDRVKFRKGGLPAMGTALIEEIHEDGRVAISWIGRNGKQINGLCYARDLEFFSDRSQPEHSSEVRTA